MTPRLVRLVVRNQLGPPFVQRMIVADERWDHLLGIRKCHQSNWRKDIEFVSLDDDIVCISNPLFFVIDMLVHINSIHFHFCDPFTGGL